MSPTGRARRQSAAPQDSSDALPSAPLAPPLAGLPVAVGPGLATGDGPPGFSPLELEFFRRGDELGEETAAA